MKKYILIVQDQKIVEFGIGVETLFKCGIAFCVQEFCGDVLFHVLLPFVTWDVSLSLCLYYTPIECICQ
jgi:hypothetical protein